MANSLRMIANLSGSSLCRVLLVPEVAHSIEPSSLFDNWSLDHATHRDDAGGLWRLSSWCMMESRQYFLLQS